MKVRRNERMKSLGVIGIHIRYFWYCLSDSKLEDALSRDSMDVFHVPFQSLFSKKSMNGAFSFVK
ncbi:MAG: hypothetical protein IJV27_12450 [Prevotella sp.]|nr:hypothetical protein [Prevotella sp.]